MASGTRSRRGQSAGSEGPCPYRMELLPKQKVSVSQLRILLTAVEKDSSLYNASGSDMVSFLNIEKWFDLCDQLNECLDGTMLNIQNWKAILRFWAESIKKGHVMSKKRLAFNKSNKSITLKEAKELTRLERRFYRFMKNEEAMDIDVAGVGTGNFGAEKPETAVAGASDNGIQDKVHLMNLSPLTVLSGENAIPERHMKRTIHLKEDGSTVEDPHHQIVEDQLDLHAVARKLEEHIATIQNRIQLVKELWKHCCDDD